MRLHAPSTLSATNLQVPFARAVHRLIGAFHWTLVALLYKWSSSIVSIEINAISWESVATIWSNRISFLELKSLCFQSENKCYECGIESDNRELNTIIKRKIETHSCSMFTIVCNACEVETFFRRVLYSSCHACAKKKNTRNSPESKMRSQHGKFKFFA